jgi:hypothetical protein
LTRCDELIERAEASQRPVRVLYISDFDPAGLNMPVAAARKIEFAIRNGELDIDVQVRPIALTLAQCQEFNLPRTPIKPSEKRKDDFEITYGHGATELDALEALHPGALSRIVENEVRRYIDPTLERRQAKRARAVQRKIDRVNRRALVRVAGAYAALKRKQFILAVVYNTAAEKLNAEWETIQQTMAEYLDSRKATFAKLRWPSAVKGKEDPDPLFDSTRSYLEQVQRFKVHKDDLGPYDKPSRIDLVELGLKKPKPPLIRRA